MKNSTLSKTYNSTLILLSLIAIVYSFYGLFTDEAFKGTYLGAIILASILLFLSVSLLIFTRIDEKQKQT